MMCGRLSRRGLGKGNRNRTLIKTPPSDTLRLVVSRTPLPSAIDSALSADQSTVCEVDTTCGEAVLEASVNIWSMCRQVSETR